MALELFGPAKQFVPDETPLSALASGIKSGFGFASGIKNQQQKSKLSALRQQQLQEELKNLPKLNELKNNLLRAKIHAAENHDEIYNSNAGKLAHDYNLAYARGDKKAMETIDKAINDMGKSGKLWDAIGARFAIGDDGLQMTPNQANKNQTSIASNNPENVSTASVDDAKAQLPITNNLVRLPSSPGNKYGNYGNTITDMNTGKSFSVPTSSNTTQAQKVLANDALLPQQLITYFQKQKPYLGTLNQIKEKKDAFWDAMGYPTETYTQAFGTKSSPEAIADQLMGALNIPKTRTGLQTVLDILNLNPYHSPEANADKVARQLILLKMRQNQYSNYLQKGMPLSQVDDMIKKTKEYQNQVAQAKNLLLGEGQSKSQSGERVKMIGPDGKAYGVLASDVSEALKQGYKRG